MHFMDSIINVGKKIRLVKQGIFPVTKTLDRSVKEGLPKTGFGIPGTLQGEGKLAGIPVLFIRTSGCNLRCTWQDSEGKIDICDTPYSSHNVEEFEEWAVEDIRKVVEMNLGNIRHLVISGGEPTIQPAIVNLAEELKKLPDVHLTLETNGIHFIPGLENYIDLFSISPKLKSSEPDMEKNKVLNKPIEEKFIRSHARLRRNPGSIQQYINSCMNLGSYYGDDPSSMPERRSNKDFQLKFVVGREEDEVEIKNDFLLRLNFINKTDILVMPVGSNKMVLERNQALAAKMAIRNGWRYSPRIQIDLFGDKAGT